MQAKTTKTIIEFRAVGNTDTARYSLYGTKRQTAGQQLTCCPSVTILCKKLSQLHGERLIFGMIWYIYLLQSAFHPWQSWQTYHQMVN